MTFLTYIFVWLICSATIAAYAAKKNFFMASEGFCSGDLYLIVIFSALWPIALPFVCVLMFAHIVAKFASRSNKD